MICITPIWDASRALHAGERLREWAEAGCEVAEGRYDPGSPAVECEQCVSAPSISSAIATGYFRAQGLSVGSGVVEAGCKTTIRLKRSGMHWSVGANTIIPERPFRGLLGASVSQQVKWISKI